MRRRASGAVMDMLLAAAATVLLVRQAMNALHVPGIDFVHVWNAAHQTMHSGGAYADPLFTYPPGSAVLLAPVGLLGYDTAKLLMLVVNVLAVLTATWLAVDMLQRRPGRRTIGTGLLALGVANAVASTWANGNVNGSIVLIEVLALRAICRGRWLRAAVLVGISLTLKPVLLPLLLMFALRRQWRELAVAIFIPAAGTAAGCLIVHDSSRFFAVVVPFLAHGAQLSFNDSLVGVGHLLHLPEAAVWALRACVAASVLALIFRQSRRDAPAPSPRLLCYESGVLLSAAFLLAPMSEAYYTIYLLPAIAAWAAATRRHAWAATVIVAACFATFRLPGGVGPVAVSVPLALRPTLGWLLCLIVFARYLSARPVVVVETSPAKVRPARRASPAAAVEQQRAELENPEPAAVA